MSRLAGCGISFLALLISGLTARSAWAQEGHPKTPEVADVQPAVSEQEFDSILASLDDRHFANRTAATRRLLAFGPQCIPLLVASLDSESREIRFRVAEILRHAFSYEQVVHQLIDAAAPPDRSDARMILRDRSLQQVAKVAEWEHTRRLFAFWGTNIDSLQRSITFDLLEARGRDATAAVVAPLIGLHQKASAFNATLTGLESLSLSYDHRHSPGFEIAETLADGLLHDDQSKIDFANSYIEAFESLENQLVAEGLSKATVRKEISDRANMSDGATAFLIVALDPHTDQHQLLTKRLSVSPTHLRDEFFTGLATREVRECYRHVGKVHIADMLQETLAKWPAAPQDGVVQNVVECVIATIDTGDKPKALALLEALEGSAELHSHLLQSGDELGQELTKRLCLAALIADNSRDFHPIRAIHDRIVRVLDVELTCDHPAFPTDFITAYLQGGDASTSESARLAIGRYAQLLEQLQAMDIELAQPDIARFLQTVAGSLTNDAQLVGNALERLTEISRETKNTAIDEKRAVVVTELAKWTDSQVD